MKKDNSQLPEKNCSISIYGVTNQDELKQIYNKETAKSILGKLSSKIVFNSRKN